MCAVDTFPDMEGPESTQTQILLYQTAQHYIPEEYLHGYVKTIPL
jgi:hypothetical protein